MNLPSKLAALTAVGAAFAIPATANAAVTSNVTGTTLNVTSDDAADTITIGDNGTNLTVNGAAVAGAPADGSMAVNIAAGGGDDTTNFTTSNISGATIDGGAGNDLLNGSTKADTVSGGDGNDRLVAAQGADTIKGGNGNDVLVWNPGEGSDVMDGEAGADEIEVNGGNNAENFTYGPGAAGHIAFQRVSPAPFSLDISNSEKLTLNANGGDDTITGANGVGGAFLTTLNGGNGVDTITGGDSTDLINGGDDNDVLDGGAGDDRINGDRGNDTMAGGAGDDTLVWNNGDGTDQMDGQDGFDRIEVNGAPAAGDAFSVAPNGSRVKFQRTNLGPFALDIGSSEDLEMNTLGGDDTISVANGLGGLIGVSADGGAGNDTISGGNGAQILRGGSGNDTFFARNGVADLVDGGSGADKAQTDALNVDLVRAVETVDATPIPSPAPAPQPPSVVTKTAKVKKGSIAITLKANSAASGQAKIVSAKAIRLGKLRAQFVLARLNYSLAAGQVRTFTVKLAPGTARLQSHHKLATIVEGVGANAKLTLKF